MENKTHKKQRSAGIFGVLPLVWAMGLSAAIPAAVGFWILFTTGPWGIPLFLTYLCLLMMPTAYLISRRENNNRRFLVGEEIYIRQLRHLPPKRRISPLCSLWREECWCWPRRYASS